MRTKKEIRHQYKILRNQRNTHNDVDLQNQTFHRMFCIEEIEKADVFLCYASMQSEFPTMHLIRLLISMGKEVYCPVTDPNKISFYKVNSLEDLTPGYFQVLEPTKEQILTFDRKQLYAAFVPGIAFDKYGNRIGYGKGYYDHFFASIPKDISIFKIGLAFSFQMIDHLPYERNDYRLDAILTECKIYYGGIHMYLEELGKAANRAKYSLQVLSTKQKNEALQMVADALKEDKELILSANAMDVERGEKNGMHPGLLDRLKLDESRIDAMAEGIIQVTNLEDPIGEELEHIDRPNGMKITKVRVPLGVIGIIYESRPNVTADAFALCFKSGNAVILKGGSDAIESNIAISNSIRRALVKVGIDKDSLQLINKTDRETTSAFMKMNEYVDVLIPRGGIGLIRAVVQNATIPVIETGTGNCHIYVDEFADFNKALDIIYNAKTQRIGVCNACESLVIHEAVAKEFLPLLGKRLSQANVEIRGDKETKEFLPDCTVAAEEDFYKEYLDYIISVKVVSGITEAIEHINRCNTGHSDAIITENKEHAQLFLRSIDSACVYVNVSTRFTDGFEFGFGAEIGISTQKLHARGPMGLKELTSYKYLIVGDGQIR